MTKKTNVVRASLTGVGGVLGASIAVAVVGALLIVPLPALEGYAPTFKVTPLPSAQSIICPGPLLQVNSDKSATLSYLSNGAPVVVTDSTSTQQTSTKLAMPENKAPATLGAPTLITVPAVKGSTEQPLVAGTQLQVGAGESLGGLATAACAEPSNDMWLVGGATDVGRTTLLVLENPTEVYSTAKLEIFGEKGPVAMLKSDGIQVPPRTQRIISVAGYARDVVAPVIHVSSSGGALLATLQQSVIRTLVPSGVEWINPSAAASTTQVMTGVYIAGNAGDGEHGAVMSDLESTIRVLVPGTEAAEVKIKAISLAGDVTELTAPMNAQQVIQFPFLGVSEGMYTVVVSANRPIVASVRSVIGAGAQNPVLSTTPVAPATPAPTASTSAAPSASASAAPSPAPAAPAATGGDFAWFTSGTFLTNSLLLPVPNGPNPMVSFYNPFDWEATVTLSARNQQDVRLKIAGGKMATAKLVGGSNYTVKGSDGLIGQLTYIGGGQGSGMTLSPANALGSAIYVYPR